MRIVVVRTFSNRNHEKTITRTVMLMSLFWKSLFSGILAVGLEKMGGDSWSRYPQHLPHPENYVNTFVMLSSWKPLAKCRMSESVERRCAAWVVQRTLYSPNYTYEKIILHFSLYSLYIDVDEVKIVWKGHTIEYRVITLEFRYWYLLPVPGPEVCPCGWGERWANAMSPRHLTPTYEKTISTCCWDLRLP